MIFGRRRDRDDASGRPLTREKILEYLEGVVERGGEEERWIERRLRESDTDRAFFESIREEVETRNTSISFVWRQERVSCPHRDLLAAYHHGSLSEAEADYIRFHLDRVKCPYCAANLDDLVAADREDGDATHLRDLEDELMRSTTAFLRRRD